MNQVGCGKGLWIPAATGMTGGRDPNGLQIPVAARVTGGSKIIERPWEDRRGSARYGRSRDLELTPHRAAEAYLCLAFAT